MDMDNEMPALTTQQSPPIAISSPARHPVRDIPAEQHMPIPRLDHDAIKKEAKKRRKNKKKSMQPGAPAANVIKGFHTPVTSGGEESDVSSAPTPLLGATRLQDLGSGMNSPAMRAATNGGGISALKMRLDALSLDELKKLVVQLLVRVSALEEENRQLRAENGRLKDLPKKPKLAPGGMDKASGSIRNLDAARVYWRMKITI